MCWGGAAELRLKQIIGEAVSEFGGMVIEVETIGLATSAATAHTSAQWC